MALALGLGLSSKLLVPAVALVFVAAALAGVMVHAAIRNHSPISGAATAVGRCTDSDWQCERPRLPGRLLTQLLARILGWNRRSIRLSHTGNSLQCGSF